MAEKIRCAVIGTGGIGNHHLRNLKQSPLAEIVALAESSLKRAKEAAEFYRVPHVYHDYKELLARPDIDVVTIALPNYLHATVAIEALKSGKHVFLEKPMATNAADAAKIAATVKKTGKLLALAQHFRFKKDTQIAKAAIEKGAIGDVYHVRAFWMRRTGIPRIGSWFTQKKFAGGGCTYDLGVHLVDCCLYLLGDFDVSSVSGQVYGQLGAQGEGSFEWGKSEIDPSKPFDVDDFSVALIRLRSGKSILIEISWAAHIPVTAPEFGIHLLGSKGGLNIFPAKLLRNGNLGYETVELASSKLPYPEEQIHYFLECVLHGKKPLVTVEQSLKVQKVLDGIYASARSGKEVSIR